MDTFDDASEPTSADAASADEWPEEFGGGPAPTLLRTGNARLTRKGRRKVERDERAELETRRERAVHWARHHRMVAGGAILLAPLLILFGTTWVQAMTKPGQESFQARNVQWLRDLHLGFVVDRVEQWYYSFEQPPDGGTPDQAIGPTGEIVTASTEPEGDETPTTPSTIPHLTLPPAVATPASDPLPDEGSWFPAGPDLGGFHGVYTTKVRPNDQKTSLLVFVAWIDPTVTDVQIHPGLELPGGTWTNPPQIPAERCGEAILAFNGGFRFDQSRGGWYSDGRVGIPMRDGAATMVQYPDGSYDIGQWGREFGDADLGGMTTARQNLELLVDGGQIVDDIDSTDWGAQLENSYFIWRSGYGITEDGALIYVGGPGLQPRDLAQTLINAGAVRGFEGDINPEWVAANLFSTDESGTCVGTPSLEGTQDKGGQRSSPDRYLSPDTRDFVAVYTQP